MKILVTFALENEFVPWRAMRDFHRVQRVNADAYCAQIGSTEIVAIVTGAGPRNAALSVHDVLKSDGSSIQFCVSSGLAGAAKQRYEIGQVLAAKVVRSENPSGARNTRENECSGALLSFAESCGATIVNRFYTSEHAIATREEKEYIGQFADAVEMESFAVLNEAAASGIPAIAIRAISDLADENLPLNMDDVLTDRGRVSIPRVLGQVVRHPGAVPGVVSLAKQSKTAAAALARFLDPYVAMVAERTAALDARGAA